jgi:hypothetical protein
MSPSVCYDPVRFAREVNRFPGLLTTAPHRHRGPFHFQEVVPRWAVPQQSLRHPFDGNLEAYIAPSVSDD